MSGGDGKDSVTFLREKDSRQTKGKKKLALDQFAQAVSRIAVAQVCESVGFQSFQQSALDTLADVGVRYIREVGKTAVLSSNSANRSHCNVFDVIQGLEDLGSIQGFSAASDVRHSFSRSGIVRDLIRFVGKSEEIPFAYLIPVFPVLKKRTLDPSFAQAEENSPDGHIPSWLPKFPDPETYAALSLGKDEDSETMVVSKIQQVEEKHRKVDMPVQNMQQRLLHNGYDGVAVERDDAAQPQHAAESNPFLAPPLQFGEMEVSLPVLPAKHLEEDVVCHQSCEVKESNHLTLEPSLKANETRSHPSYSEDRRKIVVSGRSSVHFKIGNGKKHLGMVANHPQNVGIEKLSPWFDYNDDQNGKKEERAENILLKNTEHLQDSLVN